MKRLLTLGIALMAIFALGAVAAATASAEENKRPGLLYLPKGVGPWTFSLTGGAGELKVGANTIQCGKVTGSGESKEAEHVILATGTLDYTGCKIQKEGVKTACNSEGDPKETILLPVDVHFINVLEKTLLQPGIAILPLPTSGFHSLCAAGTVLVLKKGWAMGLVLTSNLSTDIETAEVHFFAAGETCDKGALETDKFCQEKQEKEPFEVNFSGTYEKAELIQLATITWKPDMLVDD